MRFLKLLGFLLLMVFLESCNQFNDLIPKTIHGVIYFDYNDGNPPQAKDFKIDYFEQGGMIINPVGTGEEMPVFYDLPSSPTKEGYVFMGWYWDNETFLDSQVEQPYYGFDDDFVGTLYAKWVTEELYNTIFTITFETFGGTEIASQQVQYSKKVERPADPTKGDDPFSAWFIGENYDKEYFFTEEVVSDLTLYAEFGTKGLVFTMGPWNSYLVSEGTTKTKEVVIIPHYHEGLRVTGLIPGSFSGTSQTKVIHIPGTLYEYFNENFKNHKSLEAIVVSKSNSFYSSIDGVVFNKEQSRLIFYPTAKPGLEYLIPNYVEEISHEAFLYNQYLKKVIISEQVKKIQFFAFKQMNSLEMVSFKEQSQIEHIGAQAFAHNPMLKLIFIPQSIVEIDSELAYQSPQVVILLEDAQEKEGFGQYWRESYNYRAKVIFNVNYVDDEGIFYTAMTHDGQAILTHLIDSTQTHIVIPDEINGNRVTGMVEGLFKNNKHLVHVTFSSTTDIIPKETFMGCDKLEEVHFTVTDHLLTIDNYAFYEAVRLHTINLPDSIKTIGHYAFYDNQALSTIHLPESLTRVGTYAFAFSRSLNTITYHDQLVYLDEYAFYKIGTTEFFIGDHIEHLGQWVFKNFHELYSYVFVESDTLKPDWDLSTFMNLNQTYILQYKDIYEDDHFIYILQKNQQAALYKLVDPNLMDVITIPHSVLDYEVTSIVGKAFYLNQTIKEVILPDSIKVIGDFAFSHCPRLNYVYLSENSNLKTIGYSAFNSSPVFTPEFPEGLETIGNFAFFNTAHYVNPTIIPESVTYIGARVFYLGNNFTYKIFLTHHAEDNHPFNSDWCVGGTIIWNVKGYHDDGILTYALIENGEAYVYGVSKQLNQTEIVIPNTILGYQVTRILKGSFMEEHSITSITIADSIKIIDDAAFNHLYKLETLNISVNSELQFIGYRAFSALIALRSILIPSSVVTIQEEAFSGCTSLTIHVVASSKPAGWHNRWNSEHRPVIWDYNKDT